MKLMGIIQCHASRKTETLSQRFKALFMPNGVKKSRELKNYSFEEEKTFRFWTEGYDNSDYL